MTIFRVIAAISLSLCRFNSPGECSRLSLAALKLARQVRPPPSEIPCFPVSMAVFSLNHNNTNDSGVRIQKACPRRF
ncbi:MAG: hypothetical protein AB1611_08120 [bacterium]